MLSDLFYRPRGICCQNRSRSKVRARYKLAGNPQRISLATLPGEVSIYPVTLLAIPRVEPRVTSLTDLSARLLRRRDAADYILTRYGFCTEKTLAKLACVGGGP